MIGHKPLTLGQAEMLQDDSALVIGVMSGKESSVTDADYLKSALRIAAASHEMYLRSISAGSRQITKSPEGLDSLVDEIRWELTAVELAEVCIVALHMVRKSDGGEKKVQSP